MEFNATFIVSMVSFILFTILMNKILYRPITQIVEEREKLINDNLQDAEISKTKAEEIYAGKEKRLNDVALENKRLMSEKLAEVNTQAKNQTTEAKKNSIDSINTAKSEIAQKTATLEDEMNARVDEFANGITAKILGDV